MCDPFTIASVGATIGSVAMNSSAQGSVNKARSSAMGSERMRQAALDAEAGAINERSRNRYQDFGGQQDTKKKQLSDYFIGAQGASAPPGAEVAGETMPNSSSNIVNQETTKQLGKAKAYTDQQGDALGNLRSFGDLLGGISREQGRDAGYVGQIGGFKKGSAGILPYELDAAGHAGDGTKTMADLLGGLGKIGLSAGLSGGWTGGAGAGGATSMTGVPAVGTQTVTGMGAALPQAPLTLGSLYRGNAFSNLANPFRGY